MCVFFFPFQFVVNSIFHVNIINWMNRCIGGGGNKHYLGHAYHDGLKSFVFSNVMFCVMKTSQKPSDLLDRGQ